MREPKPAHDFVRSAKWWEQCQRTIELEDELQRLHPALSLRVIRLSEGELVVTAATPAVAARLRQFAPRVVESLRARGWLIDRLRLRADPRRVASADAHKPPRAPKAAIPPRAVAALEALRRDPALSDAIREPLQRLIERQISYRPVPDQQRGSTAPGADAPADATILPPSTPDSPSMPID